MTDDQDVNVGASPSTSTPEVPAREPYTLVFVSDLGGGGRLAELTPVDKEDFARTLTKARPTLTLSVASPFTSGESWPLELAIDSIKTFEPDGLLGQIPAARARLELRKKIIDRGKGQVSAADLTQAADAVAAAAGDLGWVPAALTSGDAGAAGKAPGAPDGGSLLDLVEDPSSGSRVAADVERLAAGAGDAASKLSAAERGRLNAILQRLDDELGKIADLVCKHADVRRLEAAWRSLKLLVDRLDFREGNVRLWVVDAPRDQAVSRFAELVVTPAYEGDLPTPGLVLFDHACANTPADIAMLDELAQQAVALPVPVVFPLEPAFFNVKNFGLLKSLPNLSGLVDTWQFAKWKALRDKPYARTLIPIAGRFVLRPPFESSGGKGFVYSESVTKDKELLWGGGHVAVGLCAARSHAGHGWPTRMFGANAGKLEDLPVVPNPKDANKPFGPGDLAMPDRRLDELPAVGINFLQSMKNNDFCFLLGGVSAARPVKTKDRSENQAMLEISLPYQMFANIASTYICAQHGKLAHRPSEEIQTHLMIGLSQLLGVQTDDPDETIMVGVGSDPQHPGQTIVQVRLTPPDRIIPGGLHIDFGFAVPS